MPVRCKIIRSLFPIMLGLLLAGFAMPEEAPPWQTGTLIAIDAHPEGRFVRWGNKGGLIPLYDGYPYYDLTIQLGAANYVVRYEQISSYFPSAWKVGSPITARLSDGQMEVVEYGA